MKRKYFSLELVVLVSLFVFAFPLVGCKQDVEPATSETTVTTSVETTSETSEETTAETTSESFFIPSYSSDIMLRAARLFQ